MSECVQLFGGCSIPSAAPLVLIPSTATTSRVAKSGRIKPAEVQEAATDGALVLGVLVVQLVWFVRSYSKKYGNILKYHIKGMSMETN